MASNNVNVYVQFAGKEILDKFIDSLGGDGPLTKALKESVYSRSMTELGPSEKIEFPVVHQGICEKCTWRKNPVECAMAADDGEDCPGYQRRPCKVCELNPCDCHERGLYDQETVPTDNPEHEGAAQKKRSVSFR